MMMRNTRRKLRGHPAKNQYIHKIVALLVLYTEKQIYDPPVDSQIPWTSEIAMS